jgi:hypothetical protein
MDETLAALVRDLETEQYGEVKETLAGREVTLTFRKLAAWEYLGLFGTIYKAFPTKADLRRAQEEASRRAEQQVPSKKDSPSEQADKIKLCAMVVRKAYVTDRSGRDEPLFSEQSLRGLTTQELDRLAGYPIEHTVGRGSTAGDALRRFPDEAVGGAAPGGDGE